MHRTENADGELVEQLSAAQLPAPRSPLPAPCSWRSRLDPRKKIAIVGTAPDSLGLAPYADPAWQIWCTNNQGMGGLPRWDACFDIHGHNFARDMPEYYAWMKEARGKPFFTRAAMPEAPDAIVYPMEEMLGKFGNYFTNTVAYMLAMAIEFGATQIGLFGVNMAADSEYCQQRPSCEYFIGVAVGRGIKITIPEQSDLLKTAYLYGIENPALHEKWVARHEEFSRRMLDHQQQAAMHEKQSIFLKGCIDDMRYWRQFFNFQDHVPAPVER